MAKYVFATLALFLFLIFLFCSKSTEPEDIPEAVTLERILEFQDNFSEKYEYYLDYFDSSEALNKIEEFVSEETALVESVEITEQGLAVVYTNGLRGGLLIDPGDHYDDIYTQSARGSENPDAFTKPADIAPNSKRSLFLCPIYPTRWKVADSISAYAQKTITKAGYQPFTSKLGIECGIADFIQLYNYGLIHIYTFNFDWYENEALADVYLMTGDSVSQYLNDLYGDELTAQDIAIINVPEYGNVYFIKPSVIADAINLGNEKPLFFLGYGNSQNSNWPQELKNGACIGFDGAVDVGHNINWAKSFYSAMTDTADFKQITIQDWYKNIENSYIDDRYDPPRTVSIGYEGAGDFVLWQSLRVTEIIPAMGLVGDTINIYGIGFGDEQGESDVLIGDKTAPVVRWSDTLIVVIVPEEANNNGADILVRDQSYNNISFSVLDKIAILSVTPERVYHGDLLSIHGFGFGQTQWDSYVWLGGYDIYDVELWSDSLIQVYVPSSLQTGNARVFIESSFSNVFEYNLITEIELTSISPTVGKSGELITVRGTNLGYDRGKVYLNNSKLSDASVPLWSDTLVKFIVPNIVEYGQMPVKILSHDLTSNEKTFFKQTYSTIQHIIPDDVTQLDTVRLSGYGFGDYADGCKVKIRRNIYGYYTELDIVNWSDSAIVIVVPELTTSGQVYIDCNGNTSNLVDLTIFGYSEISANKALPGSRIQIKGSGFKENQYGGNVRLNGENVIINSWEDDEINIQLPSNAVSGNLIISVNGHTAPPYYITVPRVFDIDPEWVAPGMQVTITGDDLGENPNSVKFQGGDSENVILWSDTLVIAEVPADAKAGQVEVRAYNLRRLYTDPIDVLDITSIDPLYGLPGDTINIYGTGFLYGSAGNYVTLNDQEMPVVDWNNTLITTIIPPDADSGQIVVHIGEYATIGEELAIVDLDDIFDLLHQATMCETKFSGAMAFKYHDPVFKELIVQNRVNYPGKWIIDSFEFGPVDYYLFGVHQYVNVGKVATNGSKILNQKSVYHYYWEMFGGGFYEANVKHFEFKLTDIPFSNIDYTSDTIFVRFEINGPDVENHIYDISSYVYVEEDDDGGIGNGDYSWEYQYTDWENEEYPPSIEVIFKIPND